MPKPIVLSADATVPGGSNPPGPERVHPWKSHGSVHSRVLDHDPLFNKTSTYWYDDNTREQWLTETWHDLSPLVEANKAQYNATDENARMTPRRDGGEMPWTKVASIPMALVPELWRRTHGVKDRKEVSRWLTDPENRHFLVRPIKVGV